jgi:hypothetical protein
LHALRRLRLVGFCSLQSELADRPEAIYSHNLFLFFSISVAYFYVPRSVDCNRSAILAFPFVRSMGPNTRNVCSHSVRKYASISPKTSNFGPTDIACLPGPKFSEILEISPIIKKINIYFIFINLFIKYKKIILIFFYFSKIKFSIIDYFFFDLVESKGIMPLCRTTALLAKAM